MNVSAHQEKKNEKTGKRKAGEDRPILKRLRATLLRSFRGLHGEKMVCVRGEPRVTGTLGKANSHFDPTQTGRGPHHHVEAAVDWCSSILLALHVAYILYIRQKFRTSLPKKIGVNMCFEDGQKVMMIRVKVNSKSELVEDREGKSTLYSIICCCDDRLLSRAVICGHTI